MASDGAAKSDSAPVLPSWAANHFKQFDDDKMTSILVPVGFRKYSKNSKHSTIYSGNMILLDRVLTLTH